MNNLSTQETEALRGLLVLVEKILLNREIQSNMREDEFEKYINYFFQGKDILNPYERRNAGIKDEVWEYAKSNFYTTLGIKNG